MWLPLMRNKAYELLVHDDLRDDDYRSYLKTAEIDVKAADGPGIWQGGEKVKVEARHEVMPGFIREGGLHLLNAEQGIGKSNFCLALFRDLISDQGTQSFLNLNLDRSKSWQLFLVGVDMPRESWVGPLEKYNLATTDGTGLECELVTEVHCVVTNENGYGLAATDLQRYRQWALDAKANGKRALFVFDSYNALLMNTVERVDERTQEFVRPLRELNRAMAGTGATTIMLHHTPKGQSNSTASSGGGHNSLGSIPDVVIEMSRMSRNSNRLFLASAKRITTTTLMIEQHYDEGRWECHGDAETAAIRRETALAVDKLKGQKERIYELAHVRWDTQKLGFTSNDVVKWLDGITPQCANRHIAAMEAMNVIVDVDRIPSPGRYLPVYIPIVAKAEWQAASDGRNETQMKPLKTIDENRKRTATTTSEPSETDERANERVDPLKKPSEPLEPSEPSEPSETIGTHKNPEVNVYGQATPRPQMQAETEDGTAVVITGPGDEQGFWKYQKLGQANGVIREGRWMIDLLPSGTFHPPGTPL